MSTKQRYADQSVSFDSSQFSIFIHTLHNLVKAVASSQVRREDGTERNARFLKSFGLTEREIADVIGVSQPAVNQALKRAKEKTNKDQKGSNDAVKEA